MEFHIFVIITTIIFYFVLKLFKKSIINEENNTKKQSQFIYILFVPIIMYTYKYLNESNKSYIADNVKEIGQNVSSSSDLLSKPYPESSI